MTAIERLEKKIEKLEGKIEKIQLKINKLQEKCDHKKITKAEFIIKKSHIEEKIHSLKTEIGRLHGEIAIEKRRLEEKG